MGELVVPELRHVMSLPSVLNYRVWSGRPRSMAPIANRRMRPSMLRKNLFGPVDHDENLRVVQQELNKMSQEDSQRWNFDFTTETPLAGRYQWELLAQPQPTTAETNDTRTITSPLKSNSPTTTTTSPLTTTNSPLTCITSSTNIKNAVSPKKGVKRLQEPIPAPLKQKLCTDYFRKTSYKSDKTSTKLKDTNLRLGATAFTQTLTGIDVASQAAKA